jgi:hypothetical protein
MKEVIEYVKAVDKRLALPHYKGGNCLIPRCEEIIIAKFNTAKLKEEYGNKRHKTNSEPLNSEVSQEPIITDVEMSTN